jgi:hypothetical protein
MMKIEMGKKYTSNGKPIRILSVDRPDPSFPVVGMDNNGTIHYFMKDGTACLSGPDYALVEVCEPKLGDWCWFWNTEEDKNSTLSKLQKVCDDGKFQSQCGNYWKYCSKFDGKLPKHLKRLESQYFFGQKVQKQWKTHSYSMR